MVMVYFIVGGIQLLAGLWRMFTHPNNQWEQHKWLYHLLGRSPERTSNWDKNVKKTGRILLATGCFSLILALLVASTPSRQPMSGDFVSGRQLMKAEANASDHAFTQKR